MKPVIEKNYALNGMQANLRSRVLATESGDAQFFFDEGILSSSLVDRKHGGATTIKADSISEVLKCYAPSVLVMDVEGAEIELLKCCDLSSIEKIVIEMHPHIVGANKIESLCEYLDEGGYSIIKQIGKSYYFKK
jgi:Methyltransferase FkbM domain